MFRAISLLLFLLIATTNAFSQSSKLIKLRSPEPAVVEGYSKGHCVSLAGTIRICKQLSDAEDSFVVEKNGRVLGSCGVSAYMGETSDFEVLRGDLDGDHDQLIVSNHDSTSLGMGVNYWTIAIFPDGEFRSFETPLTFSVEEYGSNGTFVPGQRGVSILTTKWLWMADPKGERGTGLYLVGQWWRYEDGQLVPAMNRSTVARRYLLSFERERLDALDSPDVPYSWLKHRNAVPIKSELPGELAGDTKAGVIQQAAVEADKDLPRKINLTFKPDNQDLVNYLYPKDEGNNPLRYIGDRRSGRLYPNNYFPSRLEVRLRGKRATVRTYREAVDAEPFHVMWLEH